MTFTLTFSRVYDLDKTMEKIITITVTYFYLTVVRIYKNKNKNKAKKERGNRLHFNFKLTDLIKEESPLSMSSNWIIISRRLIIKNFELF